MDASERGWRQLDKDIELYKFYLELLLKLAVFVFAITGAMASYYLTHQDEKMMIYSLALPILLNGGCFLICALGVKFTRILREDHYSLCGELGIRKPYELGALPNALRLFSVIYAVITAGLVLLVLLQVCR